MWRKKIKKIQKLKKMKIRENALKRFRGNIKATTSILDTENTDLKIYESEEPRKPFQMLGKTTQDFENSQNFSRVEDLRKKRLAL